MIEARTSARKVSPEKNREYQLRAASKPEAKLRLKAHDAIKFAIKAGKLVRQPCEKCGSTPTDAHHDDYSKPLEVHWLCRKHHAEHHAGGRRDQPARMRARLTHCKRGHEFTSENILPHANGKRRCRACFNWRAKLYCVGKRASDPLKETEQ